MLSGVEGGERGQSPFDRGRSSVPSVLQGWVGVSEGNRPWQLHPNAPGCPWGHFQMTVAFALVARTCLMLLPLC